MPHPSLSSSPSSAAAGRPPLWVVSVAATALLLALAGLVFALAGFRGFTPQAGSVQAADSPSAASVQPPADGVCVIDNSNSVLGPQMDPAFPAAVARLCGSLVGYDRKVFVTLVSGNAPATKVWRIPARGDSLPEVIESKGKCKQAQAEMRQFLALGLSSAAGSDTDLVGALERIPADLGRGRALRVALATDGLQSAHAMDRTLDLENEEVAPRSVDALVRRASPMGEIAALRGADVQFLLPSRAANGKQYRNGTLSTRAFWRAWLSRFAPGASLTSIDTSAPGWGDSEGGCR